jgi:hypothetical protein
LTDVSEVRTASIIRIMNDDFIGLMIEAVCTSETSIIFNVTSHLLLVIDSRAAG